MYDSKIFTLVSEVQLLAKEAKQKIAVVESCTGGSISSAITSQPGSSEIYEYGFVTYSNQAKIDLVHVNPTTLKKHTAVSAETALEMAKGAQEISRADIVLAVTGVAGPDMGSDCHPVGLVYFAICNQGEIHHERFEFTGERGEIIKQATIIALDLIIKSLKKNRISSA